MGMLAIFLIASMLLVSVIISLVQGGLSSLPLILMVAGLSVFLWWWHGKLKDIRQKYSGQGVGIVYTIGWVIFGLAGVAIIQRLGSEIAIAAK